MTVGILFIILIYLFGIGHMMFLYLETGSIFPKETDNLKYVFITIFHVLILFSLLITGLYFLIENWNMVVF